MLHLLAAALGLAHAGPIPPPVFEGEATDDFPSAVAVGVSERGTLVALCTGVVVADAVVITAAHCLEKLDLFVGANWHAEVSLPGAGEAGTDLRVAIVEWVAHPEWDPAADDQGFSRDVAVLHLAEAVPVTPAPLADRPDGGWIGTDLALVGFGADGNEGSGGGQRQLVVLPVVQEHLPFLRLYEEGAGNLCTGDSGGPAYRLVDGEPELVGLNVFTWQPTGGSGCEGGGTGTLELAWVWDWVEAEAEGRPWAPGCSGCAAGGGAAPRGTLLAGWFALWWVVGSGRGRGG